VGAPGVHAAGGGADGLGDAGAEGLMRMIDKLTLEMKAAAKNLEFERAAGLRDRISGLKERLQEASQGAT
jgi:excinuclease UvrABC helicase subunit UvrB